MLLEQPKEKWFQLREAELNALARACKYSEIPNELGYCGPGGSFKQFLPFIQQPSAEKAPAIMEELSKFYALYPYLELIASSNSLKPFDPAVVEAYWVGSPLLESIPMRGLQRTILSLQNYGLPRAIAEKKAASLPDNARLHHSFHVFYINFINPRVPKLVQNLSNCMVQWGEVKKPGEKKVLVKGIEIFSESGQLKLREKAKQVENPFGMELSPKEIVTVHWNKAVERIDAGQLKQLKHYTLQNLDNQALLDKD